MSNTTVVNMQNIHKKYVGSEIETHAARYRWRSSKANLLRLPVRQAAASQHC